MRGEKLLRIGVTTLALVAATVHIRWPEIKIDVITLGLLILACLPWLAPLIKSIEIPGVGKFELQEIKRQAEEARGAAQSASQKAEFALAGTPDKGGLLNVSPQTPPDSQITELAKEYNQIRATQPSGAARTSAMTSVVRKMADLAPYLHETFDVEGALREKKDRGKRLSAYAYLWARPAYARLESLVDSVIKIEDKPFGQYWGIQAIGKVIGSRPPKAKVDLRILSTLRGFLSQLQPGTDRYYELSGILREFED